MIGDSTVTLSDAYTNYRAIQIEAVFFNVGSSWRHIATATVPTALFATGYWYGIVPGVSNGFVKAASANQITVGANGGNSFTSKITRVIGYK